MWSMMDECGSKLRITLMNLRIGLGILPRMNLMGLSLILHRGMDPCAVNDVTKFSRIVSGLRVWLPRRLRIMARSCWSFSTTDGLEGITSNLPENLLVLASNNLLIVTKSAFEYILKSGV
ncbi:hypothetical protein TSUD_166460 [Trifolium subterraneum]|uniref:Uncharacterized protein n=1 Tax=Trifolium subterraneum TaxID=3900 RepID=A0A2Z6NJ68_TRISU|nr:hypothetical protein TSUD_166460 [Trifolium subterraneum]